MKCNKIGIMGGTFNPIHNGHIALAEAAFAYCKLDEIWFMPSGISYQKKNDNVISGMHRLEMVKLAIDDSEGFYISDIELSREGNTYTVDTMRFLSSTYKDSEFYFIMGADSLYGFPKWKCPDEIASLCKLVVVVRDEVDLQELKVYAESLEKLFHTEIFVVPFERMKISSRNIRYCIKNDISVKELLPQKVLDYIMKNKLYKE